MLPDYSVNHVPGLYPAGNVARSYHTGAVELCERDIRGRTQHHHAERDRGRRTCAVVRVDGSERRGFDLGATACHRWHQQRLRSPVFHEASAVLSRTRRLAQRWAQRVSRDRSESTLAGIWTTSASRIVQRPEPVSCDRRDFSDRSDESRHHGSLPDDDGRYPRPRRHAVPTTPPPRPVQAPAGAGMSPQVRIRHVHVQTRRLPGEAAQPDSAPADDVQGIRSAALGP